MRHPHSSVPPGFRFHPTDEELILHFLMKKLSSSPFPVSIIADVDIFKFDPWDLPGETRFNNPFNIKLCLVRKNGTFSARETESTQMVQGQNGAAGSGFGKATGTDKIIVASSMAAGRGWSAFRYWCKESFGVSQTKQANTHL
ncbi:NAC transcription factor 47-like [Gossypium arboreum]|uniref:NAC transcription factor 47-like n=1 Tax=Gossypium arboreum TaxID=29729 RepID=UPI00081965A3|nr:NAC transcription factor 47-like [Gossypium arboreum]